MPAVPPQPIQTPRRKRRLRVAAASLGLLVVLVWLAPTIVAKTGLRNRLARGAAADLNGRIEIGSASLGWFSAIELRDITITDSQGRVVARIPRVTSAKSLLALARSRSDLGEFTILAPEIEVVCEKNTTNVEDLLRRFLESDGAPPDTTRPELAVNIAGGSLSIRDSANGLSGEVRDLNAQIAIPAARSTPITIRVTSGTPGKLEAEIELGDSGKGRITTHEFALDVLAPLLSRIEPGLVLAGSLTADVTGRWQRDSSSIDGTIGTTNLAAALPELNGDVLRLASARLQIRAKRNGRAVQIDQLDLSSDIGTISVSGAFDPGEPIKQLLDRPGAKIDASINVARLAAKLPKLLRIREGTELNEGQLVVKVQSAAGPGGTAWIGEVNTSAIRGRREGRDVRWEEPLAIEFAGRYKAGERPTFDKLICRSDFIAINAQTTQDTVRAAANFYLDRLTARLSEFIDLGGATIDGRGNATLVASRTPTGEFQAEGTLELQQFAFTTRSGQGLEEPSLKLDFTATGLAPSGRLASVAALKAKLIAGNDELHLTMVEPIADVHRLVTGSLEARLTGGLGRWWSRVGAFVNVPQHYVLSGAADARGTIRFTEQTVAVDRLSLAIDEARFRGAGLDLAEPRMTGVADLTIDHTRGIVAFERFTIKSNPLSVTQGRLIITAPEQGEMVVEGGGPAEVGLNRLGRTLQLYADPQGPDSLRGRGTGAIRFRYSAGMTAFGGSLDFVNFSAGPPNAPAWTEPEIGLVLDAKYTEATESLAFAVAKLERPGLALDTTGSLNQIGTTADLKMAGKLSYDHTKLTPKLRELLGGEFSAQGTGSAPLSLSGSLSPRAKPGARQPPGRFATMAGEARIGWESLRAYGFDAGRGELQAKLADGYLRVNPIAATFGGGQVNIHPTLRLDPEPAELTFKGGKIVDRARLTPTVCAQALGYALPAIANSGKAEGELSILLGENRVVLSHPEKSQVKGRIVIHKATVAPGPVVTEIARILGAGNIAMTVAGETTVPVRVENGRVHHQNLAVQFGEHTVITSGSVGFDSTLDLIADVPIPAGLLKNAPLAAKALAGKRLQVPIKGTLSRPALDPRQFQLAVAKLAQEAARTVGKDLLNKELEKLFPGMPPPK